MILENINTISFAIFTILITSGIIGLGLIFAGFRKGLWQNYSDIVDSDKAREDKGPKIKLDRFKPTS